MDILSEDRIVSGSEDKLIKVWSLLTGECLKTLQGHQKYVWCVKAMSNGETIISGSGDSTIKIW